MAVPILHTVLFAEIPLQVVQEQLISGHRQLPVLGVIVHLRVHQQLLKVPAAIIQVPAHQVVQVLQPEIVILQDHPGAIRRVRAGAVLPVIQPDRVVHLVHQGVIRPDQVQEAAVALPVQAVAGQDKIKLMS